MTELPVSPLLGQVQVQVPGWMVFLIVVAVFVVPFALGSLLGRLLRARDLSFKIGVVLFTVVLGVAPFVWQSVLGRLERNAYEAALARWESHQLSEAERDALDEKLEELDEAKTELRIER